MENIAKLNTEQRNPLTSDIDKLTTLEMVQLINSEDKKVADAIENILPDIAKAIDIIYNRLKNGGRLIYIGAGTSGRIGLMDAAECPPTFGVDPNMVIALIAGGAVDKPIEGAEDNKEAGVLHVKNINISNKDVLVGIAASGRTPYVIGAMEYAKSISCFTIALACVNNPQISNHADISLTPIPGPEVITGSTRLKSGTAQKMVINMLSTGAMIKLGKTYGNLMVDVKASNKKLISRAINIVCMATGINEVKAQETLNCCEFSAKHAILMILADIDFPKSKDILNKCEGHIHLALKYLR